MLGWVDQALCDHFRLYLRNASLASPYVSVLSSMPTLPSPSDNPTTMEVNSHTQFQPLTDAQCVIDRTMPHGMVGVEQPLRLSFVTYANVTITQ